MRTLINTHHHGDHTNGNRLLPDATIVGHEECRRSMTGSSIGGLGSVFEPIEWGALKVRPPEVTFADRLDL